MNFIRRIGRNEIYIKYVHQLVNVGATALPSAFVSPYMVPFIDALAISKLRRGCSNVKTARGPLRMGFELVRRAHG